jgi:hypothetical protein
VVRVKNNAIYFHCPHLKERLIQKTRKRKITEQENKGGEK